MRNRSLVLVAGPASAGKTMFVERLLGAEVALAICIRAVRDSKLKRERESDPKSHPELCRYRRAGATAAALYHFPRPDPVAFFTSHTLDDYSEAVFIEGDDPTGFVDLSVYVVAPLPAGRPLLRRLTRNRAAERRASAEQLARALEDPDAMARLLVAGLGEQLASIALRDSGVLDEARRSITARLDERRREPPPAPTEHWALETGYEGIAHAQLVVVNVRSDAERTSALEVVEAVMRLRKDEAVFRDVMGIGGSKVPISVVVADLSNPKDPGLKKALARVKRVTRRTSE